MTTEKLWATYQDDLLLYLTAKLQDPEVAKDLMQDVFVKILSEEHKLHTIRHPDRWIFRLAKNTLIDHTRKKREARLEHLDRLPGSRDDSVMPVEQSVGSCVETLVAEYEPEHADLLLEVYMGHLTQRKAAKMLGIPYSTFKSRVQAARRAISERFVNECCRLLRNGNGAIISCEPIGSAGEACC